MGFIINSYRHAGEVIKHTTFDGTNESISVDGLLTSISTDTIGSISIWFYSDNTPSGNEDLFSFGAISSNEYLAFRIQSTNKIQVVSVIGGSVKINAATTTTITNNTWNNLIVSQDGVEPLLYLNDSPLTLSYTTSLDKTVWINDYSLLDSVNIGRRRYNSASANFFDGKIDKVIVYDDVLTSGERTTIYNYGRKAGLIGIGNEVSQWELDTLNPSDEIGSNDGTSTNMDSSNIVVG